MNNIYFWLGFGIAISIELLTRIGQSGDGDEPEEHEQEPISISNGTLIKGLIGAGFITWLFRRKK